MVSVATDFEALFRSEYPRLVSLGVAMSGRREIAHELAQETMLRAHRRWGEVVEFEAPGAWCRKVMVNLLIDQHRSSSAERSALERLRGQRAADVAGPAESRWQSLVADLPDRQRTVVTLYYGDDLSIEQIATTLGVAPGTVKTSLFKARQSIARRLADEREGDGKEHHG